MAAKQRKKPARRGAAEAGIASPKDRRRVFPPREEVYYPILIHDHRGFPGSPDDPGLFANPFELFEHEIRRHEAWARYAASSEAPEAEFGEIVLGAALDVRAALEAGDAFVAAEAALRIGVQASVGRFVERLEPMLIEAMRSRDGIAKGSSRKGWFDRIQMRNARDTAIWEAARTMVREGALSERAIARIVAKKLRLKESAVRASLQRTKNKLASPSH